MPLTTSKRLLIDAQKNGYAVPAFNIENMEMAIAVIEIANKFKSPVILQTTPSTVKYASLNLFHSIVQVLANQVDIPVVIHLDHGRSFELIVQAIEYGYTSVMIDGSYCSFEENVALTKRVVDIGMPFRIAVEGELGKIGGKEDELDGGDGDQNTDPFEAAKFADRTGVDSLAIAVGTAHGIYKGTPNIDIKRIYKIREMVDIPLVLHGTTGVDSKIVKQCIKAGICKVNYATELRVAYSEGVREVLENDNSIYDPKIYGRKAMKKVEEVVEKNIKVCIEKR